ncbi:PilZ domain-containing protein [Thalassotalea euphylliae]|uniref:PilZ domain-containing protein n=1 Tax=Thalassotalea euphylliae TaxID=1655234 RepID=A0A3E0TUW0_9GAMM|nr:PilZ domain-containing protein [Thalassotalea euphylliae]REL27722.1 PilZ domain-containing protein [Thalassotalea euphylliae]
MSTQIIPPDLQTKLQQFDEFFSIEHQFNINLTPIAAHQASSFDAFMAGMPLPFKMASDMVSIDQAAIRSIQGLGAVASQLSDFLNHQAHKIDLLVGYILSQQDEPAMRYQGIRFGGGGVIFTSAQTLAVGQRLEMKIFLLEENCAVYCIGELVEVMPLENDVAEHTTQQAEQAYKVVFEHIREEDQETLVRHSLHQQSKQLQALAQKRREQNKG